MNKLSTILFAGVALVAGCNQPKVSTETPLKSNAQVEKERASTRSQTVLALKKGGAIVGDCGAEASPADKELRRKLLEDDLPNGNAKEEPIEERLGNVRDPGLGTESERNQFALNHMRTEMAKRCYIVLTGPPQVTVDSKGDVTATWRVIRTKDITPGDIPF